MATISMFFGIAITMLYNEHGSPHFHGEYQGQRGVFDFDGNLIRGNMCSKIAKTHDSKMGKVAPSRIGEKLE